MKKQPQHHNLQAIKSCFKRPASGHGSDDDTANSSLGCSYQFGNESLRVTALQDSMDVSSAGEKKQVTFRGKARQKTTVARSQLTPEDFARIWYSREELDDMHLAVLEGKDTEDDSGPSTAAPAAPKPRRSVVPLTKKVSKKEIKSPSGHKYLTTDDHAQRMGLSPRTSSTVAVADRKPSKAPPSAAKRTRSIVSFFRRQPRQKHQTEARRSLSMPSPVSASA